MTLPHLLPRAVENRYATGLALLRARHVAYHLETPPGALGPRWLVLHLRPLSFSRSRLEIAPDGYLVDPAGVGRSATFSPPALHAWLRQHLRRHQAYRWVGALVLAGLVLCAVGALLWACGGSVHLGATRIALATTGQALGLAGLLPALSLGLLVEAAQYWAGREPSA